jgi:hypothetical protein
MAIDFQSSSVKQNSDPYEETSEINSEQPTFTAMTSDDFLRQNRQVMLKEEIDELSAFPVIYYAGSIVDRLPEDLVLIKQIN